MKRQATSRRTRRGTAVHVAFMTATAAFVGCSGGTPDPFRDGPVEVADLRAAPDEILFEEIEARGATDLTAMAVIRRLRPGWLQARGRNTFGDSDGMYPVVYIDEIRHGALGTLHGIPASEVLSIQYFNTADATTRWGTGHPSGVINIETGR